MGGRYRRPNDIVTITFNTAFKHLYIVQSYSNDYRISGSRWSKSRNQNELSILNDQGTKKVLAIFSDRLFYLRLLIFLDELV